MQRVLASLNDSTLAFARTDHGPELIKETKPNHPKVVEVTGMLNIIVCFVKALPLSLIILV